MSPRASRHQRLDRAFLMHAEQQSKAIKAIIDYNKSRNRLNQAIASTLEVHDIRLVSKEDS